MSAYDELVDIGLAHVISQISHEYPASAAFVRQAAAAIRALEGERDEARAAHSDGFEDIIASEAARQSAEAKLEAVREALAEYHAALIRREHGGIAQDRFVKAVEKLFERSFDQAAAEARAMIQAQETQG